MTSLRSPYCTSLIESESNQYTSLHNNNNVSSLSPFVYISSELCYLPPTSLTCLRRASSSKGAIEQMTKRTSNRFPYRSNDLYQHSGFTSNREFKHTQTIKASALVESRASNQNCSSGYSSLLSYNADSVCDKTMHAFGIDNDGPLGSCDSKLRENHVALVSRTGNNNIKGGELAQDGNDRRCAGISSHYSKRHRCHQAGCFFVNGARRRKGPPVDGQEGKLGGMLVAKKYLRSVYSAVRKSALRALRTNRLNCAKQDSRGYLKIFSSRGVQPPYPQHYDVVDKSHGSIDGVTAVGPIQSTNGCLTAADVGGTCLSENSSSWTDPYLSSQSLDILMNEFLLDHESSNEMLNDIMCDMEVSSYFYPTDTPSKIKWV